MSKIPFQFNQFFQSYTLFNPASAGHEARLELKAAYSGFTGIRKTIYNTFTTLNYRISENEQRKHVIGLNIFGDVEGKYLTRTRLHLNYAYHLRLNEQYTLSSGASVGFYNSTVKVNPFVGGGSDLAPDLNLGLWFYNHSFGGGISYGQALNATVTPILETTRLTPYWNINLYKKHQIDEDWMIRGDALIRFAENYKSLLNISAQVNYIQKITLGANYQVGESLIFFGGLDYYKFNNQTVSVLFSYNVPLTNVSINNSNKYELTISFFLDKDEGYKNESIGK